MKWATSMVCGYCCLEQPVAPQCKGCSKKLATSACEWDKAGGTRGGTERLVKLPCRMPASWSYQLIGSPNAVPVQRPARAEGAA